MRQSTRHALALLPALAFGFAPLAPAQIAFTDATLAAGISHSSETYGASWGDVNGDGLPDLYVSNHRTMDSLWVNRGNGTFLDEAGLIPDFVERPNADTHAGTWADFDNDGDQDLMISTGSGRSELLVNEAHLLVDRTLQLGAGYDNRDARMPIWLDYDGDHRLDVVLVQFGGAARLLHQLPNGGFADATHSAKLNCAHVQYGQLFDANADGRLDFVCPGERVFPQGIYDATTLPWTTITGPKHSSFLPPVSNAIDSVVADFNNDGRMDIFLLGGGQLRPSGVAQGGATRLEANLAGGAKGFYFTTTGLVTMTVDWNAGVVGGDTDVGKIQIGRSGRHPSSRTFTLSPVDPSAWGMPPPPAHPPAVQMGYDPSAHRWTLRVVAGRSPHASGGFSQAYFQVASTAAITGLAGTGLWPTDQASRPTLLMNQGGTFLDETVAAGLGAPVQCSSAVAGDFDNDMYVDLYLACRTGASNTANILYHNNHNGTFSAVPLAGGAAGPIGLAMANAAGTADSVVTADYDRDGFLDLFVTNGFNMLPMYAGGPNKLYHNTGNANHWIELDLVGVNSDRDATGARVWAAANGVLQMRVQDGGYHRWSQNAKRIHFGLAGAPAVNLTVRWPSGSVQSLYAIPADHVYRITENVATPVPIS